MKIRESAGPQQALIHHSLILDQVMMPEHPAPWPRPLSLALGMMEFLLLEGLSEAEAETLLGLAATLHIPAHGRVLHWGEDLAQQPRHILYQRRRRIAYIAPSQVLLHRLTVLENITLAPRYHRRQSPAEVIQEHTALLKHLEIMPYLAHRPPELPEEIAVRVLWARAFIKNPELILAAPFSFRTARETNRIILTLLEDYRAAWRGAVLLVGTTLESVYPLADRLLRLQSGHLEEVWLPGPVTRPVTPYISFL